MSFQERLKKLRVSKKLTQEDMAKLLGITRQAYGYYESSTNQRETDHEATKKLANFFEVSIDYLLGNTDNPSTLDIDEEEFKKAISDPDLKRWYSELPNSDEEDLRKLRKMWDIIKNEDK
ncbi:helix-turn-helix domain-containing protein [Sporosarcina sp. 6E9]|uniref:helix-turn-helix domain-containing protein n=1 Tax=Sporosarcina sp. 6E9 TaxID=2819235 RepID=UPI001ACFF2C3|nr:helix-turn-helix transcriptional regulator [Sporosarcina sp. 6E9]MBO1910356.1 helix-turn-helix transcriptional regulator [Microvirga sp. 3-52]